MKRIGFILLCVTMLIGLCACGNNPSGDSSAVSSDIVSDREPNGGSTTASTTTTVGALVVTDTQGSVVTGTDGSFVTTLVTGLPTTVRPVTNASGSTVTGVDGTVQTEVVIPPHITVTVDEDGTLQTSVVPEQTVTTASSVTATTATVITTVTTAAVSSSTTHAAATTEAQQTTATTAATGNGGTTTRPTQQQVVGAVSLPAEGYSPDNRIQIGEVSLIANVVTMEIKNVSSKWETADEVSYFEYTCYNKNNIILGAGKIEFGFIPVNSSKVCTFTIPDNTAEVLFTKYKAEYWSKLE